MNDILVALATGVLIGGIFRLFDIAIPAPPNLAGIMGIVGLFAGYKLVDHLGWTVNVLEVLGV